MYRVAIDVGGTHTDSIAVDNRGQLLIAKAETTPDDLTRGVLASCAKLAGQAGKILRELLAETELFLHGTTVGTNAVIQGKGPKVGCLVTQGFRDIVELRRGARDTLYNLKVDYPPLLSPRHLRAEVRERVSYTGAVLEAVDEQGCRQAVRLLKARGAESIAITFLFSFLNSAHEKRAREIVREEWPEAPVSLSSEVLPRIEEFERFSTTVLDAFTTPSVGAYLKTLNEKLHAQGFRGRLLIGQANGSVATPEVVLTRPVWTLSSGPAAAAPAGLYFGKLFRSKNIISVDMGGTSFDVLLIVDNEAQVTTEEWVGPYRLAVPLVKVRSIGAGGGSVAWVDPAGVLRVGPQSAGAAPGPACYAKEGLEPTVTDADLILGYLNPANFLGGERRLDSQLAEKALRDKIAAPLKVSLKEAASGVIAVLVHQSAEAIRRECMERGADPRDFTLIAGGGAGPTHAAFVAEELGLSQVVIPNLAGAYCAFGWLRSDMTLDFVRSRVMASAQADLQWLAAAYREMEEEAKSTLGNGRVSLQRLVEARYYGQFHETEVEVPAGRLGSREIKAVTEAFHRRHERLFHFRVPDMELEFIHYRVRASLLMDKPVLRPRKAKKGALREAQAGTRECCFGKRSVKTPIFAGSQLSPGARLRGPAIIEEGITTLVVPPSFHCQVDRLGNYLLEA
ncbi:MAG: hypothetical protein A3F90_02580 [Deltaproteobacteria bacterium RIFCSPLOWO2_12_FULL_60_19]|nr:MAG: hypothetical protein A3F90_02580 [Deltaproteobacteria bacterium RIFCSPLOWO2_12_FULL_60_19]